MNKQIIKLLEEVKEEKKELNLTNEVKFKKLYNEAKKNTEEMELEMWKEILRIWENTDKQDIYIYKYYAYPEGAYKTEKFQNALLSEKKEMLDRFGLVSMYNLVNEKDKIAFLSEDLRPILLDNLLNYFNKEGILIGRSYDTFSILLSRYDVDKIIERETKLERKL